MDSVSGGQMERVKAAMERALAEQWGTRHEPLPDVTPFDAAAPRSLRLAEVTRLSARPRSSADEPPPGVVPPSASDAVRIREIAVDAQVLAQQRLVAALPGSPEREAYCVLQAVAAKYLDERKAATLGVTGPRGSAGKTLTAVNLAIGLARDSRRKVFLVDLDLRRPGVQQKFGLAGEAGVEGCLFEGVAPTQALFSPSIDGLAVLAARGGSRNVGQVLRSANLVELLASLRRLYLDSILVLDLPPLADRADAAAFEQIADALLLVVEDGVTTEREYRRLVSAISPPKLLGTVLNRIEVAV